MRMRSRDFSWHLTQKTFIKGETMTDYDAVAIAEGYYTPDSEVQLFEAWQHLIDTGLAWKLQGWFGRQAKSLIEAGYCREAKKA